MTSVSASQTPRQPFGRKPPGPSTRCRNPVAGPGPMPADEREAGEDERHDRRHLDQARTSIRARRRAPTCAVLIAMSTAAMPTTHTHAGTPGNQNVK